MTTTSTRQRKSSHQQRGARRWRIPPPLRGAGGGDGPEGLVILQEIKGPVGTLLWTTLRSVNAWIETSPSDRNALFPKRAADWQAVDILTAGPQRELESALQDLAALLRPGSRTEPEMVGQAATRVARWAEYNGYRSTSAAYFDAAANACLGNPGYSLAAGRSARDNARYPQAEAWFQRAIGVARQEGNWLVYADAYLAYGTMMRRRGNMPSARKHFERALRRGTRISERLIEAKALHHLFAVEFECENFDRAEKLAVSALRAYPENHFDLPRLAHDVAYFWVTRGDYASALEVFRAIEPLIPAKGQPTVAGGIALAAAGCGDVGSFESARRKLSKLPVLAGTSEAWLEVSRGAVHLGRSEVAASAARTAISIATERKEHKIVFLAEEQLERVQEDFKTDLQPSATLSFDRDREHFVDEIVGALQSA